jgi:NADH-quinone oxidoreductase subunit J
MNTVVNVIFLVLATQILVAALMVVTARNIIHAALWLISAFFGVGALYLLMEAEFLAAAQILIYVGATSILILFAIMLTRHVTGSGDQQVYRRWWVALLAAGSLFGLLLAPTLFTYEWRIASPPPGQPLALSGTVQIGTAFMREYLLPFTLVSVLLLVALVGAIVIAFEERSKRRKVLTLAEEVALKKQAASPPAPDAVPNTPPIPAQPASEQ